MPVGELFCVEGRHGCLWRGGETKRASGKPCGWSWTLLSAASVKGLTRHTAAPELLLCFLVCVKPQAAEMIAWCEGWCSFPGWQQTPAAVDPAGFRERMAVWVLHYLGGTQVVCGPQRWAWQCRRVWSALQAGALSSHRRAWINCITALLTRWYLSGYQTNSIKIRYNQKQTWWLTKRN